MPLTHHNAERLYYHAAVYRLADTCVRLQEDMHGYYRTAAVAAVDGIVPIFRWFARRNVKNVLISQLSQADTHTVMDRLGWDEDFCRTHRIEIHYPNLTERNPFATLIDNFGLSGGRQLISVADTPEFLDMAWAAGVRLNVGVTYGSNNYRTLSEAPNWGLLDNIRQLPNFIIENGIEQDEGLDLASLRQLDRLPNLRLGLRLRLF